MSPHTVRSLFLDKRYFVFKRYNIWMSEKNETLIFTFLMFERPLLKFESYVNGKNHFHDTCLCKHERNQLQGLGYGEVVEYWALKGHKREFSQR